jgi:3-hydroxymyristoyl/3-hydroxydecanoyl-(acyl carrier protein) dehydratase
MSAPSRLSAWVREGSHPDREEILSRARRWNADLDSRNAPPAVHLDDAREAFAFLLACWSRGWAPLLLPDRQDATLALHGPGAVLEPLPSGSPERPLDSAPANLDAVAVRFLTSGSTGARKQVPKTFGQIEGECEDQRGWSGELLAGRRILTTVSHQHIYGFLFLLARPALEGLPFPERRDFYWEEMVPRLRRGPCTLVTSPSHLQHLVAGLDAAEGLDLLVLSSGGAVSDAAGRTLARGARLLEIYGSTETGGVARRAWTPEGSGAWIPFASVGWSISPDEGRLVLRSPWADPDHPHRTDDLAEPDGDGFRLRGRADRVVKLSEKRLSLEELEEAVRATGLCDDARACVVEGGRRQELGLAAEPSRAGWEILLREGRPALADRLRQELSQRFEPVLLPRRFRFSPLPRNPQGKVVLAELAAHLAQPEISLDGIGAACVRTETGLEARVRVPANYPRLEGHFPGSPVVPGVAQLHWALDAARTLEPGFSARQAEAVKFQSVLRPGVEAVLAVSRHNTGWRFSIEGIDGRKYSSGRLLP